MKHWANPRYWRWLWNHRIGRGAKAFLVTLVALLAATGGYASARGLVPEEKGDVFVERVVTLVHKEQVPGSERVVTVRQTVTTREPQKTKVVTVNGRTITGASTNPNDRGTNRHDERQNQDREAAGQNEVPDDQSGRPDTHDRGQAHRYHRANRNAGTLQHGHLAGSDAAGAHRNDRAGRPLTNGHE